MKEELCKKVVEVRRKSDRVMEMVLVFEEEVIRVICAYAPQVGRSQCQKDRFLMIWQVSGICKILVKRFLVWRISMDMLEDGLMVLRVCMVGMELAKEIFREEDYMFCDKNELCTANIYFEKKEQRKIQHSVLVEMKLRLILHWLLKTIEST